MNLRLATALGAVPGTIRTALEREYVQLEARFARGDWGPAELNGGRLAEALLRYLEWKQGGTFTPVGTQLNRTAIRNAVRNDGAVDDGLRLHVLACVETLMDVRNRRDVAHLGSQVDVAEMDAHLVMRLAAWCLSELVRVESGLPSADVQTLIDRLSVRHLPLVEEVGGDLIVVATGLPAIERALVALYHQYPRPLELHRLRSAVGYQNSTRFRALLESEAKKGLVYIKDTSAVLTAKGAAWVEKHVELRLTV